MSADGGFDFTSIKRIPRSFFESMRGGRIAPFDILVVKDGATTGKTSLVRENFPYKDAAVNEHVFCVRVDSKRASPTYVFHFLTSSRGQKAIRLDFRGATVGGISREFATKTILPLPPLPEQRRIADVLDRAEALRAKRRAAIAQLHTLTQSIFLDLYQEAIKSSPCLTLAQVAETSRGSFVNGPFGSDLLTDELQEEGVPVIYIRDIRNGEYMRVSKSCVSEQKARELAVCTVTAGDVLVAKVGDPPGVAALYPFGEPRAVVTQDVVRLRVERTVASPEFVVGYLNSSLGRRVVAGITVQATRARFALGEFKRLPIWLPSVEVQRDYARKVGVVDRIRVGHRASLAELDALVASLQDRAFRGEL